MQPPAGMHWLFTQVCPASQAPQSSDLPQASPTLPQYLPRPVPQVVLVHDDPPTQMLFWHDQPVGQAALQFMEPPQPSPNVPPQYWPPVGLHVSAVQPEAGTHWLPLQISPAMHPPQLRLPPQPSPIAPQYLRDPTPQLAGVQLGPPTHIWLLQSQPFGQGALQAS